ncbi:MAG: hypothetical protein ACKN89_13605 [Cyanobium sp.]
MERLMLRHGPGSAKMGTCSLSAPPVLRPANQGTIPSEALAAARAWVRQELWRNHLPGLPDRVEDILFLQGRSAWSFRYPELKLVPLQNAWRIELQVLAILKKEFHEFLDHHRYTYQASLLLERKNLDISELNIEAVDPAPAPAPATPHAATPRQP